MVLVGVIPICAQAQTGAAHQVELGAFGSYTRYDQAATNLTGNSGAGGRLGFYFSRLLSVESEGDYTVTALRATGSDVTISRVGATMLLHARAMGLYLGAGYERLYYRGALSIQDDGGHAVLGTRMSLAAGQLSGLRAGSPTCPVAAPPRVGP